MSYYYFSIGTGALQKQLSLRDETITCLSEEVLSLKKEKDATILTLEEQNTKLISKLQELNGQLEGNILPFHVNLSQPLLLLSIQRSRKKLFQ